MAKPMNMGGNGWIYSSPLSIKDEYGSNGYYRYGDIYAIYGYLYSKVRVDIRIKRNEVLAENFQMLIRQDSYVLF